MSNEKIILTAAGVEKLKEELHHLETVERAAIIERIKEAKSFGDLSENSEYDEAKKAQGMAEGRIKEITAILARVTIAETPKRVTKVCIGSEVEVLDKASNKTHSYKIVGSAECNPLMGEISDISPVGSALIDSKKGDVVVASTPAGDKELEVLSVKAIKR